MHHGYILTRRVLTTLLLALTLGVRAVSAESISIQWDPNTEHDLQGYRVYIGTQPGVYTHSVDVGNTTSFVYNEAADGQRYCFAVAAFSAGPIVGARSTEVCSDTSGNEPPTLQNPGSQANEVGVAMTLQLVGADPESSPVTYSAIGLPTGITINTNTGFLSGTPTKAGTFSVQATISDGSLSTTQSFSWTIGAALPGVATLLRPTGAVATNTPTFEWESVAAATSYRIWVDDASATDPKIQLDYTPVQAGCSTAGAVCQARPGIALSPGRASWSVRVTNASGQGPWSGAMDFTVPDSKAPTVAIAVPTANPSLTTTNATISLGGTASDDQNVTQVTWTSDRGGSGTATGTASWTAGPIALRGGSNILTITARDAGGNIATDVLTVTREDSAAPTVSIASPTVNANHTTDQATLNIAGTASDDIGVAQVTWATDRGASGVASGTTEWTIANVPLAPGVTVITVTAKDDAGRSSADMLAVTRTDSTAPTVDITSPSALATFSTTSSTINLGGAAGDNVGVTQVTWSNSKGGSGTTAGTTSWSVAGVALKPGANVITVTARDAQGNVASDSLTVTLTDSVAPVVTIATPTMANTHSTRAAAVALGGSASDVFGVTEVRWANSRGGAGLAAGTTDWSVPTLALQSGVNVITVIARDAAGNTATDSIAITADTKAPILAITSPAGTPVTSANTVTLIGTVGDDSGVTGLAWANNRGGSGTIAVGPSWSASGVPLEGGANVITVTAQDAAGNRATASLSILQDSRAPSIVIRAPAKSGTVVVTLTPAAVRGTANDNEAVTRVTWENNRGGNGIAAGTSNWTIPSLRLKAGTNVITVTAHDAAGNTRSDSLTLALDQQAPVVSISAPTAAGTLTSTENEVILRGSVTDDTEADEVSWTNSQGGGGVARGTASWAARVALRLGLNAITVTARDAAGRTGTATLAVRVTDVKAPAIRILSPSATNWFSTEVGSINLGGYSADDFGPVYVTWASDRGGKGVANGDNRRWTVSGVALQQGVNVITVTARDAAGNTSIDTVRVTVDRRAPAIALTSPTTANNFGNPPSLVLNVTDTDTTAPVLKVFLPTTAATFATAATTITIGGTATDAAGVTEVWWTNAQGGSGVAFGTSSWGAPSIPLAPGVNVITVTARDAAGNAGEAVLTVTSSAGQFSSTPTAVTR